MAPLQEAEVKKSAVVGLERGFSLLLLDDVPTGSFENGVAHAPVLHLAER